MSTHAITLAMRRFIWQLRCYHITMEIIILFCFVFFLNNKTTKLFLYVCYIQVTVGDQAMIDRLLAAGADVKVTNVDGNTPLHIAALTYDLHVIIFFS